MELKQPQAAPVNVPKDAPKITLGQIERLLIWSIVLLKVLCAFATHCWRCVCGGPLFAASLIFTKQ